MDFEKIKKAGEGYLPQMTKFLRDLIKIPGESCGEEGVIKRIAEEMNAVGFDKVEIDGLGNVLGYMGNGNRLIAYDAHIDTVGLGNLANWKFNPYEGYENETEIGGRGTSDQLGGIVSAVYGAKIMKDLSLIPEGTSVLVTGTVQEEDCDGMCWQYIHNVGGITPEFVVITEPTDGGIYRGHRGRMEIRVEVKGISCHGSAPERGDNAIYKMADILKDVEALNKNGCGSDVEIKGLVKMLDPKFNPEHYEDALFLGRGTVTTSEIFFTSPSRCAVADSCTISLDRRMTAGETWDSCIKEIEALPACQKHNAKVTMYMYDRPAWTGEVYETECYFPTWINKETSPHVQAAFEAHKALFGTERTRESGNADKRNRPLIDKWTFSTNGVSIQGRYGVPCVGFGPGAESQAHAPNEITWKKDLSVCAAVYALVPSMYKGRSAEDTTQFRATLTDNNIK